MKEPLISPLLIAGALMSTITLMFGLANFGALTRSEGWGAILEVALVGVAATLMGLVLSNVISQRRIRIVIEYVLIAGLLVYVWMTINA